MTGARTHTRIPKHLVPAILLLAIAAPAAAGPDEPGPFAVGRTTFPVMDAARDDRTFLVDVWYPVDPADAAGVAASVYDLALAGLPSELALDEPPVSAAGPFPLVVFSHGNAGIRFQSLFLTEHLASHGYVVASPDHAGNTALDVLNPGGVPFEIRDRPLDVSLVISRMLQKSADPGDAFSGSLDGIRIGVVGHSFGGFTTLAMGAGFGMVPPDPRVRALVPIAPAAFLLTDEQLASIDVPELVIGGTLDETVPLVPSNVRSFELPSARPRYRLDVIDAGHNSFTNICDIADALAAAGVPQVILDFLAGNVEEGCAPELIPVEEAHRLTNLYVVAFLDRNLAYEPLAAAVLQDGPSLAAARARLRTRRFLTPAFARGEPVDFTTVVGGTACGLGFELAFALPLLQALRLRRRRR